MLLQDLEKCVGEYYESYKEQFDEIKKKKVNC